MASNNKKVVEVRSSLVDSLNSWCEKYKQNSPIQNFDQLKQWYEAANPGPTSRKTTQIKTAQHAELTIAVYLVDYMQSHRLKGSIELGVSKASCMWCQSYLKCLDDMVQPDIRIVNRATHGKRTDGWLIPDTPAGPRNEMLDQLGNMVQQVFDTINTTPRRSDSIPLVGFSSADEDPDLPRRPTDWI